MKIAIDAMGGDRAPQVVIDGVIDALSSYKGFDVVLVGNLTELEPLVKQHRLDSNPRISFVHAEQVVNMDETSTIALRAKKNSSITVVADLVGNSHADALVTIGHTGAAVAATKVKMRTLAGVDRPAIGAIMPARDGKVLLLDAGANVDCTAFNLAQFAVMGEVYYRLVLGVPNPKVGLLSVGDEDTKGNGLTKESFKLLSELPINFIGNVEGNDIFEHKADVIVCDGFVGNAVLKASEGLAKVAMHWMKMAFTKNPFRITTAILAQGAFQELKEMSDSEEYGGAPLLGINGICIKGHGRSSAKAVRNAIKVAVDLVNKGLNDAIIRKLDESKILMKPPEKE